MQPQFDELWGGVGQMYETRLGTERMRTMNALGRAQRAGAILCGGDDSPVCNLSPLEGMQATVDHHEPQERLSPHEAVTMYTYNAARLAHAEKQTGIIAPGFAGDFVVLDRDPLDGARFTDCAVLATWADGKPVYETSAASAK
jgi:predicted amidohydrolase YtcJ